jgi:hypothetical protein
MNTYIVENRRYSGYALFEVITVVTIKSTGTWDVISCRVRTTEERYSLKLGMREMRWSSDQSKRGAPNPLPQQYKYAIIFHSFHVNLWTLVRD